MYKFNSIDSLRHARDYAEKFLGSPKVSYEGTVKIHGANMSVVCSPEGLSAQSRRQPISTENDVYGFAAWLTRRDVEGAMWTIESRIRHTYSVDKDATLVIFGEWCGPGIHSGVAVNELSHKHFVIFDAAVVREEGELEFLMYQDTDPFTLDNDEPLQLLHTYKELGICSIADAPSWYIELDFSDEAQLAASAEKIADLVGLVEAQCPYAAVFGVKGVGEGIVWRPYQRDRSLMFKSKGEKHKVRKPKSAREPIAPEILAGTAQFVEMFVTEARMEQGLTNLREDTGQEPGMRSMGAFLKWLGQDVQREGRAELEASGLTWKQVSKDVSTKARDWYKGKVA